MINTCKGIKKDNRNKESITIRPDKNNTCKEYDINKIEKVSTLVNGRISAVLVNSERMIITRVYAHAFKQKLNG